MISVDVDSVSEQYSPMKAKVSDLIENWRPTDNYTDNYPLCRQMRSQSWPKRGLQSHAYRTSNLKGDLLLLAVH